VLIARSSRIGQFKIISRPKKKWTRACGSKYHEPGHMVVRINHQGTYQKKA